jgi:hypothetical protein
LERHGKIGVQDAEQAGKNAHDDAGGADAREVDGDRQETRDRTGQQKGKQDPFRSTDLEAVGASGEHGG